MKTNGREWRKAARVADGQKTQKATAQDWDSPVSANPQGCRAGVEVPGLTT